MKANKLKKINTHDIPDISCSINLEAEEIVENVILKNYKIIKLYLRMH